MPISWEEYVQLEGLGQTSKVKNSIRCDVGTACQALRLPSLKTFFAEVVLEHAMMEYDELACNLLGDIRCWAGSDTPPHIREAQRGRGIAVCSECLAFGL